MQLILALIIPKPNSTLRTGFWLQLKENGTYHISTNSKSNRVSPNPYGPNYNVTYGVSGQKSWCYSQKYNIGQVSKDLFHE